MYVLDTLGKLRLYNKLRLRATCGRWPDCSHSGLVDLDHAIRIFGSGYEFIDDYWLGAAMRCTRCGHQGASLTQCVETSAPDGTRWFAYWNASDAEPGTEP